MGVRGKEEAKRTKSEQDYFFHFFELQWNKMNTFFVNIDSLDPKN